MTRTSLRAVFTPAAVIRLVIAWGAYAVLLAIHDLLAPPVPTPLLVGALVGIVAVILVAAFGVVHEAEHLAKRLGDPYGSLVLTLSIVIIEVVLIAAVMLGPGEHAMIARDSVSAVMMIILGLVVGAGLLVGGIRHGGMRYNRTGTTQYVAMIAVLAVLAFVFPAVAGEDGSLRPAQVVPTVVITVVVYGFFLFRQLGAQASDFHEVDDRVVEADEVRVPIRETLAAHRSELGMRLLLLVATMVPIVLLSHDMATLLNDGLGRLGAPPALAGVLIAMIVFTPESITAVRAAARGEMQRVINLCLGAFVSTVGLTIPSVLVIGALTGQTVVLAESPAMLAMILAMTGLSAVTFSSPKVTASHGGLHLVLFAVYGVVLFTA